MSLISENICLSVDSCVAYSLLIIVNIDNSSSAIFLSTWISSISGPFYSSMSLYVNDLSVLKIHVWF